MKASEQLIAAADLIERTGWTQEHFARDSRGKPVITMDESACCFCLIGALDRVRDIGNPYSWYSHRVSLDALSRVVGTPADWCSLSGWNDKKGRTKDEVVAALRKAAEIAAKKESTVGFVMEAANG